MHSMKKNHENQDGNKFTHLDNWEQSKETAALTVFPQWTRELEQQAKEYN